MESDWRLFPISKRTLEPQVHPWENLIQPILKLTRHLSPFPWFISSFGDPWEVIGGHSPPQNGLQPLWYIFYKIWYILKFFWYIQSLSYWDPYLITHGPFIPLGIFEKWLKVIPYSKIYFGTLCTSLRKFDTSNLWANGTPSSLPMVHFFLWRPSRCDWRSFPTLEWTLAPLVHPLQNLAHSSQNLVHP